MKQNSCVVASLKHDGMSEIIWFYCVRRLVLEVVVKLDKNHGDPFWKWSRKFLVGSDRSAAWDRDMLLGIELCQWYTSLFLCKVAD